MSEHTALPWMTDNVVVFALDAEGFRAAKVCILKNDSRDGAFIVRSCNSFDEMVKALELAAHFISNGIEFGYIRMPENDPLNESIARIHAALSKARALP